MKKQEGIYYKTESRTAARENTVVWTQVAESMTLYCDLIRANPLCFIVAPPDQTYLDFCASINALSEQHPALHLHWLNRPQRLYEKEKELTPCVGCEKLTKRQHEVLSYLKMGKSNKEIARVMGISEGTVKLHCIAIYEKLGVHNRTQAAVEQELI